MWHLYFWVPTRLFVVFVFRALKDLYRSCKSSSQLWSLSVCLSSTCGEKCYSHNLNSEKKQAYMPSFLIHPYTHMHLFSQKILKYPLCTVFLRNLDSIFMELDKHYSLPFEKLSCDSLFWKLGVKALDLWTPSLALHRGNLGRSCLQETPGLIFQSNLYFVDE